MEDRWCNTVIVLKEIISYVESKNNQTTHQLYQLWEQNTLQIKKDFSDMYFMQAFLCFVLFYSSKTRGLVEEIKSEEDMVYNA